MNRVLIEQLAGYSTPLRIPIDGDNRREQRNWIVRHARVPVGFNPDAESVWLSKEAALAIANARAARGLPVQDLEPHVPLVSLMLVDDRHLVVTVTTIRLEDDEAHEYLVAASAALSVLDKRAPIEDIQGIPRRFWRFLLGEAQ
jgi:hypothetical protein